MLKRDSNGQVMWDDADVPDGYAGSWHVGEGVWHAKCRACGLISESYGPHPAPRYSGIGRHEYDVHGLDVAGINVGMLS